MNEKKDRLIATVSGNQELISLINHAFLKLDLQEDHIVNSDIKKIEKVGGISIAKEMARIAYECRPANPYFLNLLANLLLKTNNPSRADEIVEMHEKNYGRPNNPNFLCLKASVKKNVRDYKTAIRIYEELVNAGESAQIEDLAQCYFLSGEIEKAEASLESVERTPKGCLILAKIYKQKNQNQRAIALLRPLLGRDKKIDTYYNDYLRAFESISSAQQAPSKNFQISSIPISDDPKTQQERFQFHRLRCRAIAEVKWEHDKTLTIEYLSDKDTDILNIGCKGHLYKKETIRNWIKDLCPDRSKGRRPFPPKASS